MVLIRSDFTIWLNTINIDKMLHRPRSKRRTKTWSSAPKIEDVWVGRPAQLDATALGSAGWRSGPAPWQQRRRVRTIYTGYNHPNHGLVLLSFFVGWVNTSVCFESSWRCSKTRAAPARGFWDATADKIPPTVGDAPIETGNHPNCRAYSELKQTINIRNI